MCFDELLVGCAPCAELDEYNSRLHLVRVRVRVRVRANPNPNPNPNANLEEGECVDHLSVAAQVALGAHSHPRAWLGGPDLLLREMTGGTEHVVLRIGWLELGLG